MIFYWKNITQIHISDYLYNFRLKLFQPNLSSEELSILVVFFYTAPGELFGPL